MKLIVYVYICYITGTRYKLAVNWNNDSRQYKWMDKEDATFFNETDVMDSSTANLTARACVSFSNKGMQAIHCDDHTAFACHMGNTRLPSFLYIDV